MSRGRSRIGSARRGVVSVVMIVVLLIVSLIITGAVLGTARDQDLSVRRLETAQAFYAAEGGINMAIRELMLGADEDGDGAVGTISDDADGGNDPVIGTAQVLVTATDLGAQTELTSVGRSGQSQRRVDALTR